MWTFSKTQVIAIQQYYRIMTSSAFKTENVKLENTLLLLFGTHVAPEFNVVWNHSVFRRLREITADLATVAAEDKEQSICSLIAGHVPLLIWQTKECSHACSAMHSNWLWMAPWFTQGSLWWAYKTGCLSGFWVKLFMRGWKQLGCSAERTQGDALTGRQGRWDAETRAH